MWFSFWGVRQHSIKGYHKHIFIAEHGSWNRSIPIGYGLVVVKLENNQDVKHEIFAQGWLKQRKAWGSPVDLLNMPDVLLLVSDDKAGVICKISYEK